MRVALFDRFKCGQCEIMTTSRECICCCEIDVVISKMGENDSEICCIVEHKRFQPVCLDVWVPTLPIKVIMGMPKRRAHI